MFLRACCCVLLLHLALCAPLSSVQRSESTNILDEEDNLVGGYGSPETPPVVVLQAPMASLIEEDEGSTEQPCNDCMLNRMIVPPDFSGDLNELAEQAYSPSEEDREKFLVDQARRATKRGDLLFEDEAPAQVLQFSMKPGDVLIGGLGVSEQKPKIDDDEAQELQMNLEVGEGRTEPEPKRNHHNQDGEVAVVKHASEVLKLDVTSKDSIIQQLSEKLDGLRNQGTELAGKLKNLFEEQDKTLSQAKELGEQAVQQAKKSYDLHASQIKSEYQNRLRHVVDTEHRIHDRVASESVTTMAELKQSFAQQIAEVQKTVEDLESQAAIAEARRASLLARDEEGKGAAWEDEEVLKAGEGLRAQLINARAELEELHSREASLEDEERTMSTHIRDEHAIRSELERRIQHLHRREAAIEEAERAYEATNAGLRHDADEIENQAEDDADAVGHARDHAQQAVTDARAKAQEMLDDKEKRFEQDTMRALNDEIARLKGELERRQRREAHAEQELLQQEKEVRSTQTVADQTEQAARHELQVGHHKVEEQIERINEESQAIVNEARAQSSVVFNSAKSEMLARSQIERDTVNTEIVSLKDELARAEAAAKEKTRRLREGTEEAARTMKQETQQRLDKEAEELKNRLTKEAAADLAAFTKAEAEEQNNADADLMMAQIREAKDKTELKELETSNAELHKAVAAAQDRLKHEQQELEFQKLVRDHPVGFAGESD